MHFVAAEPVVELSVPREAIRMRYGVSEAVSYQRLFGGILAPFQRNNLSLVNHDRDVVELL
jgi:hypothetical protein